MEIYLEKNISNKSDKEEIINTFLNLVKDRKIEYLWELYRIINFRTALRGAPTVDAMKVGIIGHLENENEKLNNLLNQSKAEIERLKKITKDQIENEQVEDENALALENEKSNIINLQEKRFRTQDALLQPIVSNL